MALGLWHGVLTMAFAGCVASQVQLRSAEADLPSVVFSEPAGFHLRPIQVVLSVEDRASDAAEAPSRVVYTVDGSVPGVGNPTNHDYDGSIPVDRTRVIRARVIGAGGREGPVSTRSFLFVQDVIRQPDRPAGYPDRWRIERAHYGMDPAIVDAAENRGRWDTVFEALPTLSIALPVKDLFGPDGIYDFAEQSGADWERAASAEWIFPERPEDTLQIDCGLRVQGGMSRNRSPKHSMSLRFRSRYGATQLRHSIFPGGGLQRFDSLQLRGMYNNSWIHWHERQRQRGTLMRDQWMRDSMIAMGHPSAGHGGFFHLFLNGLYWGIYNIHERPNAAHGALYLGLEEEDLDAVNGGRIVDGNLDAWQELWEICRSGVWDRIQQRLHVDSYIDMTLLNRYANNNDLKVDGNWRAVGGGPDRHPWRFYVWDAERSLEEPGQYLPGTMIEPVGLFDRLFEIPEFRGRVAQRVHRHLNGDGALTPEPAAARWQARVAELEGAIVAESARWGRYRTGVAYTEADWRAEAERLVRHYFPERTAFVFRLFDYLGYDGSAVDAANPWELAERFGDSSPPRSRSYANRTVPRHSETSRVSGAALRWSLLAGGAGLLMLAFVLKRVL